MINKYWRIIILGLHPLLLTIINPNWLYNPEVLNFTDTWIYNGLFRYFVDFASQSPSNIHYFIERVSWGLPGYGLYQFFSPEIANAILHLGVFYLCVFSIYGTLKVLFGQDTAFITALCLAGYTWFLRAVGHDYVDGIGIAYFSAALFFATLAAYRTRFTPYVMLSGVFIALMLLSQLFLVVFLPAIFVYFYIINQKLHRHPLALVIGRWIIGSMICVIPFVAINFFLLGEWNIFKNSLVFVLNNTSSLELRKAIIRDYASTPATWLVLPCLLMVLSIVHLVRWKSIPETVQSVLRLLLVVFILCFGIFLFFHHRSSYPMLWIYLYMSLTIPATFLLLGGLISVWRPVLRRFDGLILLGFALLPFSISTVVNLQAVLMNPWVVWGVTVVLCISLVVILSWRFKPTALVMSLMGLSLFFSGHNGLAIQDRLYNYRTFKSVDYILAQIEQAEPNTHFKDYLVWSTIPRPWQRFSYAIRGMTQPIHIRMANWSYVLEEPLDFKWGFPLEQDIILFVSDDAHLQQVIEATSVNYLPKIAHTILLPEIDPTGSYRMYLLKFTQKHNYDEVIFPSGDNIQIYTLLPTKERVAWTGPDSQVVMRFNLPPATSEIYLEICALAEAVRLPDEVPARVNQEEILLVRQAGYEGCTIQYTGLIPSGVITGSEFTEIAVNIPVSSQTKQGIALSHMTFGDIVPIP